MTFSATSHISYTPQPTSSSSSPSAPFSSFAALLTASNLTNRHPGSRPPSFAGAEDEGNAAETETSHSRTPLARRRFVRCHQRWTTPELASAACSAARSRRARGEISLESGKEGDGKVEWRLRGERWRLREGQRMTGGALGEVGCRARTCSRRYELRISLKTNQTHPVMPVDAHFDTDLAAAQHLDRILEDDVQLDCRRPSCIERREKR